MPAFGRVCGISPGVTGAATERPLERVESNEVRTRGIPPPSYTKKRPQHFIATVFNVLDPSCLRTQDDIKP